MSGFGSSRASRGESLLPKVERYFAGGDTTIRGFQLDRARIEQLRYLDPSFATGDVYRVDYRPLGGPMCVGAAACLNTPGDLTGTVYGSDRTGGSMSFMARGPRRSRLPS